MRLTPSWRSLLLVQAITSVADNALFLIVVGMLLHWPAPAWMTPALKLVLLVPFVVLAPWLGRWCDRFIHADLIQWGNALRILGCVLLLTPLLPLIAFSVIGLGNALSAPARYALMIEITPPKYLVMANALLEGVTIVAIISGALLGGYLADQAHNVPALYPAVGVMMALYVLAVLINFTLPRTKASPQHVIALAAGKRWRDSLKVFLQAGPGRIALLAASLLWGACAVLQVALIDWAAQNLQGRLQTTSWLIGIFAGGIALGAVIASRYIALAQGLRWLPLGLLLAAIVASLPWVFTLELALFLMLLLGILGGVIGVPLYALIQAEACRLMPSGRAVAMQNFSENTAVLLMIGLQALLLSQGLSVYAVLQIFAGLLALGITLLLIQQRLSSTRHVIEG